MPECAKRHAARSIWLQARQPIAPGPRRPVPESRAACGCAEPLALGSGGTGTGGLGQLSVYGSGQRPLVSVVGAAVAGALTGGAKQKAPVVGAPRGYLSERLVLLDGVLAPTVDGHLEPLAFDLDLQVLPGVVRDRDSAVLLDVAGVALDQIAGEEDLFVAELGDLHLHVVQGDQLDDVALRRRIDRSGGRAGRCRGGFGGGVGQERANEEDEDQQGEHGAADDQGQFHLLAAIGARRAGDHRGGDGARGGGLGALGDGFGRDLDRLRGRGFARLR